MIQKICFSKEWIDQVSQELGYPDKELVEKVIHAFSLLELLASSGCPFVWKGGTALMLILNQDLQRISIDIDVICPPETDIVPFLNKIEEFGFINYRLEEKKLMGNNVPKSHSKFFYQIAYRTNEATSYIKLDVLYEDLHYAKINEREILTSFFNIEGKPLLVKVPSAEDILGDKLTAFAPNTCGIPYRKNGDSMTMQIIKQLFDVGRLFDAVSDLSITSRTFLKIVKVELAYRGMENDVDKVYEDIRQTALLISTKGQVGEGDYQMLVDGIKRVKSFMYKSKFSLEDAIVSAAKAAYLASSIQFGNFELDKYDLEKIKDLKIADTLTNKLNKLKLAIPEAYFYWCLTSQLLKNGR